MAKIKGTVRDEDGVPLDGVKVRAHRLDTGEVLGEVMSSTAYTGDALEANVALRVNFNEGYQDISSNGFTLTANNFASRAFQTGWGYELNCTDGSNNAHVATPASAALKITGAFCLECRVNIDVLGGAGTRFISARPVLDGNDEMFGLQAKADRSLQLNALGALVVTPAATFAQYTHFHLAVTRDVGGVMRIFHNGALVGGGDPALHTATVQMTSDTAWYFGANPDYFGFGTGGQCVLDDIVLTLGSARYSPTGFTPPAAESVPGVPGSSGAYEITTSYTGEAYTVGIAPADPVRNHSIIRVVPG